MTQIVPAPMDPRGSLPQIILNIEELYEGTLIEYFQGFFLLANNTNLPYHNFRHCTHVLYLCHEGSRFYRDRLSKRRIRNVLVAALFHDYNHRGVGGDDAENISLAISALEELLLPIDREAFDDIKILMRGTQYPYVFSSDTLPLEGLILRDADLMQAFSPAWIQQVVFGLAAEWGKSPRDVLVMQQSFLGSIKFDTEWGRLEVPDAAISLKINEAQALVDIIDMPGAARLIREAQTV